MGKLILILGGARSGKSSFAVAQAKKLSSGQSGVAGVAYVATASAVDEEMKRRIERHRKRRPASWKTIEERVDISKILAKLEKVSIVIIDCLTILISNFLLSGEKEAAILKKIKELSRTLKRRNLTTLIVSNEVGMGIVPENRLGRSFRDIAGQSNQIVAELADEVYLLEAGIPVKIKDQRSPSS
ncbi:MAG: bifunctional adenosylcobinamide kinase/adenosylcobinamide-phosphate guanylyltransferase [bacterium]